MDIDLVLNFKCTEECLQKKHVGHGHQPGETWQGLLTALHLQHMNALNVMLNLLYLFLVMLNIK